jgi:hypothetical protein
MPICKKIGENEMKKLLIMVASCLVMFGTAQAYAADLSSGDISGKTARDSKDQKADSSKDARSDKSSDASAKKGKAQTLCPVMGDDINMKKYADVKGKRIYVCCNGCIALVKAEPDKYIKILEDQGVEIEKVPASNSK